jgi:hypothetical protein
MADEPKTRLDRIARDSSRTWLHGSRVTDLALSVRPATIATGQQIPVDLPASGPMNFVFTAGAATANVLINRADAIDSKSQMTDALGVNAARYLTLSADPSIPTWIAGQRAFSIPNPVPDEDKIDHVAVPGGPAAGVTVIKLPYAALGEVSEPDAVVSLCRYDAVAKAMVEIPNTAWQPAVLLRFKLQPAPPVDGLAANEQVFEVSGVPQGDRYYLDHLGLLDAHLARRSEPNPPDIVFVGLALQKGTGAPSPVADWTILRTNLTREARSASVRTAFSAAPPPLPYLAVSGVDGDQDKDALRLLQMISITNSGGYYLRAVGAPAGADTLVLSIVLKRRPDGDPHDVESAWLPRAANAVALTGTMPDSIRFNGLAHLQIAPAVPVGVLAFGWTRIEPANITDPEDKFGFGTISLVDYAALDGAGAQVGKYSEDTVVAISPTNPPSGDQFPRYRPRTVGGAARGLHQHTGDIAVLRPTPSVRVSRVPAIAATNTIVRCYRSTLTCYDDTAEESPYARMTDPQRSQVVFTPGFRDVFGNRFDAVAAPPVQRRVFYTDALIAPSEWPGIRFALCPGQQNGKPFLFLEMQYRFLGANESKQPRIKRLKEVCNQLRGVQGDVTVVLSAAPIASATSLSGAALADQIGTWIANENANGVDKPDPLFKLWATVPCDGVVADLAGFEPALTITRTRPEFGPSATDLPSDGVLAGRIKTQVMSARSEVTLQASSTGPTTMEQLLAPSGSSNDDAEFRAIATAFQIIVGAAAKSHVGFLRDRLNRHRLWFVPDTFFPTAAPGDWSFATARPLSTKPGAETFGVPDFDASCSTTGPDCWNGHPIVTHTLVDQDYDELGRIAFRLIEQQSVQLGAMSTRDNADAARKLLSARERIALSLASFQGDGGPGYVVPLFAAPGDMEPATATRIASDAFLSDLSAFYDIDTILQLPLATPGDARIQTFEAATTATFTGSVTAPQPKVSDVLLGGGERKVTLLYDLPPGVLAGGSLQRLAGITARIHHVQLPLDDGSSARSNVFNQGAWLELAQPFEVRWTAPATDIQVADRRLPAKPVLQAAGTLLSGQNSLDAPVNAPLTVDATSASLLLRWGWQFVFGLLAPGPNDTAHVTASYNRAPATTPRRAAFAADGWTPQSLLNVLFALKLLRDAPAAVGANEQLSSTSELAAFLVTALASHTLRAVSFAPQPEDHFLIPVSHPGGPTLPVQQDTGGCAIMKGPVGVVWTGDANQTIATVTARSDDAGNGAYLMGSTAVRKFHLALRLRRNETLGGVPANAALIYECATVESPADYWARNIWPARIGFDSAAGQPLQAALQAFFDTVFRGADLSTVRLEVGASLAWHAGQLTGVTPFFILPPDPDMIPGAGTAKDLTDFVFGKYDDLLKTGTPTDVALALRLRVKLATNDPPPQQRTLLDIAAIDFRP